MDYFNLEDFKGSGKIKINKNNKKVFLLELFLLFLLGMLFYIYLTITRK